MSLLLSFFSFFPLLSFSHPQFCSSPHRLGRWEASCGAAVCERSFSRTRRLRRLIRRRDRQLTLRSPSPPRPSPDTHTCPGHASGKREGREPRLSEEHFLQLSHLSVSQPGLNGMEPAFGEAYGGHRGLLSPYPLAMSPQGGRTEYDQVRSYWNGAVL